MDLERAAWFLLLGVEVALGLVLIFLLATGRLR